MEFRNAPRNEPAEEPKKANIKEWGHVPNRKDTDLTAERDGGFWTLDSRDLQRLDRGQLVKLTGYRTVATIGKRVKLVEARRTPKDERLISEVDEREAIVDQVVNRDDGKQDIWLRKLEA